MSSSGGRGPSVFWERALPAVFAVILPPGIWIGLRILSSRFGGVLHDDTDDLYSVHDPVTILMNLATVVLGMFVQGPMHWARLLGLPWKLLPIVGGALSCLLAAFGSIRAGAQSLAFPCGSGCPSSLGAEFLLSGRRS